MNLSETTHHQVTDPAQPETRESTPKHTHFSVHEKTDTAAFARMLEENGLPTTRLESLQKLPTKISLHNSFAVTSQQGEDVQGMAGVFFDQKRQLVAVITEWTKSQDTTQHQAEMYAKVLHHLRVNMNRRVFPSIDTPEMQNLLNWLHYRGLIRNVQRQGTPPESILEVTITDIVDGLQQAYRPNGAVFAHVDSDQLRSFFDKGQMSETEQVRYIMERLTEGKGKCRFEYGEPSEPITDLPGLDEMDMMSIQPILELVTNFVNAPMILDSYGNDHGKRDVINGVPKMTGRRGWRDDMEKRFGTVFIRLYEENRLKWGAVSRVRSYLDTLADILVAEKYPQHHELLTKCLNNFNQLLPTEEAYNELSPDAREERVREVTKATRTFLTELKTLSSAQV